MPKDCVYQLRLTSEEKAKLASVAKERDSSIAQMIRKDYGLDQSLRVSGEPLEAVAAVIKKLPRELPPEKPGPLQQMFDEKRFKQLVAQLQARMPLAKAEEEARKRLGMD